MNITGETIRFYLKRVWRYPKLSIAVLIIIPLTILEYNFVPSLIVANVLSRLSKGQYQPHNLWASFGWDLILYLFLQILGGVIAWRVIIAIDWILEARVLRDIAELVFKHLSDQSAGFHANHFGGSLVSQTNKLMSAYVRVADTTMFQLIPLISSILWAAVLLFSRAKIFVILLLVFSIAYIGSAFLITKKVRHFGRLQAEAESVVTGNLADTITNVMAVKSFAAGKYETKRFEGNTEKVRIATKNIMLAGIKSDTVFSMFTNTISALALLMAVLGVMVFHSNISTVFLILTYTANLVGQLWNFSSNTLRNYNRSLGDASEMIKILQIEPEIKDPANPEKVKIDQGAINFHDVVFTHDGSDDALFQGLNLNVKHAEKIGLVGHSGSGKTTLTKLLLRFSDLDSGEITIDGQNIAHITQDDLRSAIAYVPQEPLLFHRTIRENIAYGDPKASDKEVRQAAIKANADEFIQSLPQKYETLVGERGVKLSGGQRQRIAIARAILKKAPILVLDEATSSLDSESEQLIQSALKDLMANRTAIVVAHRLSTIQKMDRIVVMDNGKIIEQGSHAELLKQKGTYAKLWAHQSGGFLED